MSCVLAFFRLWFLGFMSPPHLPFLVSPGSLSSHSRHAVHVCRLYITVMVNVISQDLLNWYGLKYRELWLCNVTGRGTSSHC
ncbi:hypothetical protein BDQ17DRAFT_1342674 [Cyathus striatus]|nr:hypothetical protein BDQ17DRAFT_1342674 [Cyathus striatus]